LEVSEPPSELSQALTGRSFTTSWAGHNRGGHFPASPSPGYLPRRCATSSGPHVNSAQPAEGC